MFNRILALIVKETLMVLRNKDARLVLIVPPLMQLFIFAFAATLDVQNIPIGILNRDNGEKSIELVQRFNGIPTFNPIYYLKSVEEITSFIDQQKGVMVLSIDEQFSRNLDAKKPVDVQLILDGRKSNTVQIVVGYVSRMLDDFNQDIATEVGITLQNTKIYPRNWFNPNLIFYWYNVPCLAGVLTMTIGFTLTALSVAREREMGTFDQLLVSPLQPFEILLGKSIPAIIISLVEATIIILAGIFIFRIPFTGYLILFYLSLFVFVCSVVGLGLLISSISETQQQAILGAFGIMSPAIILSGFATPIENMPKGLQYLTYINPLRYILVIAKGLFLKAMPADIVLSNTWPMAVIALFTLTGAAWFFRKRLE